MTGSERDTHIRDWCDAMKRCSVICFEAERRAEHLHDRDEWERVHKAERCRDACRIAERLAEHYISTDMTITAIRRELTSLAARQLERERAVIAVRRRPEGG